ncbi:MAG: ankyrin repeat domain-containing protein [Burkholderiales bacterium]|nr:ankyrin repeat domain-containing protein [Burkholderiales bacterium]
MTTSSNNAIEGLIDLIERGDVRAVAEALGADRSLVSARTPEGDNVLHIACWQKQVVILGTILAYEPDVNARGSNGRTPLHYAVHEGGAISAPIVGSLLALGADPSIKDDYGFTVEDLAKIELHEGLREVLDLLRRPSWRRQP